ncbi:acyltransferase family protein [Roseomonas sp. CCTCC AB2023176]|uniref:acyltransferase family protein n=1 Tax=Roseomonas sp. CCTCC AB2023176 TaxID=3342640 RepID=UPI0035D9FA64
MPVGAPAEGAGKAEPPRGQAAPHRVAFADALRGPAALLVLLSHHLSLYWHAQPFAAGMTGQPDAFRAPPAWTDAFATLVFGPIRAGPLGVALFFLISGYVIPFALRDRGAGAFLAARAARLLPTYWAGYALQAAVVAALATTFPRTAAEMLANLLPGAQGLSGLTTFDGIVWTLNVEVLFYLCAAAIAPALRGGSVAWLAMPAGAGLLALALTTRNDPEGLMNLSLAATMIVFLSIGTALYLAERYDRWARVAPWLIAALLAAFSVLAGLWPPGGLLPEVPSYLLAAVLFLGAFLARRRLRVGPVLSRLAAISYPLYVVHGVSGFAIMGATIRAGWPPAAALALALLWSFGAALALHRLVERPTRRWASRLGRPVSAG